MAADPSHAHAPATGRAVSAAELAESLPGALAARERAALHPSGRDAGVLVVLFDLDGDGHLVLTKRSDTVAHHKGEVSLPGGKLEPHDDGLLGAALRETHEEIGIPPSRLEVLGPLDDVRTMASGFTVSPWVAHHPGGRPAMTPQDSEIARIMEVSLRDLLAADRLIPARPDLRTLRYPLHGEDVWGLTARILRTFADVVHRLTPSGGGP